MSAALYDILVTEMENPGWLTVLSSLSIVFIILFLTFLIFSYRKFRKKQIEQRLSSSFPGYSCCVIVILTIAGLLQARFCHTIFNIIFNIS